MKPHSLTLLALAALAGCAGYLEKFGPGTHPDTRVVLDIGQEIVVSSVSDRIIKGAVPGYTLRDVRCPPKSVMLCESTGGTARFCRCI